MMMHKQAMFENFSSDLPQYCKRFQTMLNQDVLNVESYCNTIPNNVETCYFLCTLYVISATMVWKVLEGWNAAPSQQNGPESLELKSNSWHRDRPRRIDFFLMHISF